MKRHNFAEVDDSSQPPAAGGDCGCNAGGNAACVVDLTVPAVDVSTCAELHDQVDLEWCPCVVPGLGGAEV